MGNRWWLAALLWLITAPPALAHSPVPGFEGFYIGLLHPFSSPAHALVMMGLGLLIGGLSKRATQASLVAFMIACLAGIAIGIWLEDAEPAMFVVALLVCGLTALWPRAALPLALVLVGLGGFLVGQVSIPDPGPMRDRVIMVIGSYFGANLGLLYIAGGVDLIRERYTQPWVDIALRVLAAWLGAISLVMFALGFAEIVREP